MGQRRDGFLEEFNLFTGKLRKIEEQSGHVAAGVGETLDPSARHRIAFQVDPDNRDSARRIHRSLNRIWSGSEDYIAPESNQLARESGEFVADRLVITSFNDCVPTINVAGVVQALRERRFVFAPANIKLKTADARDLACCRLRYRRKGPRRCRAAEQRDEIPPPHSITS